MRIMKRKVHTSQIEMKQDMCFFFQIKKNFKKYVINYDTSHSVLSRVPEAVKQENSHLEAARLFLKVWSRVSLTMVKDSMVFLRISLLTERPNQRCRCL